MEMELPCKENYATLSSSSYLKILFTGGTMGLQENRELTQTKRW